ncbi:MAG: hypothetical protein DRJ03_05335 [Chloroflexi bacterium]|nr:MAG: hypothetical protein DRJ03_05335 [Chloroflexota bacterium]
MSMEERYGTRDLTYSSWHRTLHPSLHYIDLDAVEYCARCKEPLALLELAQDVGQTSKTTTVLRKLARRSNLPAYLVFWKKEGDSISQFRIRQVWPNWGEEQTMSPEEYEGWLLSLRSGHRCPLASSGRWHDDDRRVS